MPLNFNVYLIPLLLLITFLLALIKRKNAYASFVEGSTEGLKLCLEILVPLLAMLMAVTLLRASGLIDDISYVLKIIIPGIEKISDLLPLAFFRSISGSASFSYTYLICQNNGVDSFVCNAASAVQGSTDTTLYVLTLYFTSAGIVKWRHALKAGLIADFVGISMAIFLSLLFFS